MTGLSSGRGVLGGLLGGTSSAFDWDSTEMLASPPSAGEQVRLGESQREAGPRIRLGFSFPSLGPCQPNRKKGLV